MELGVLAFLCATLVAAWLIYQPGLAGPFLLDDNANISQTRVDELGIDAFKAQLRDADQLMGLSRLIPRISFSLTLMHSGDSARPFKYQNLLLHLINGLLVYWFIWLLFRQQVETTAGSATNETMYPEWLALVITAIWLLHPLQASTVLYAVQRLVLLASMFMLAALICYVKGRRIARSRPVTGFVLGFAGVTICGMLALLSKEIAALLPLLILSVEWFFFRFAFKSPRERLAITGLLTLIALVPLIAGAFYLVSRLDGLLGWHASRGFSGVERLMTETHVIALYLKLFFVPIPGTMSLFHDNFPITHDLDASTLGLATLYVTALVAALALRHRAPWVGFGIVWFFICHLLESTIIPIELVFEHRNYLAILGLSAALVAGVLQLLRVTHLKKLAVPIFSAWLLILGLNTAARATVWGDLELMLTTEYARRPDSVRVLSGLVNLESSRGNQAAAIGYLNQLLALDIADAGPELGAMPLFCRQPQIPDAFYAKTRHKLRKGRLSPFAVTGLGRVVDETLRGNCPALAAERLLELTTDAVQNPNPRGADQRCLAAEMQVRVLIDLEDWRSAQSAWDAALDHCTRAKPPKIRHIIENPLRFAQDGGHFDATVALARIVTAEPRYKKMLDRGYAGSGGFDLDRILDAD